MEALLNFLRKNFHWLLFVVLEVVSLSLLIQYNKHQRNVWFTAANTVVGTVNAWEQQLINYAFLGTSNKDLTEKNIVLEHQNALLRKQIAYLKHDTTYQERVLAKQVDTLRLLPAKVVTNSVMHRNNFLTINVGACDGVRPEMGVICGTGVIGIVYMVSDHFSLVMSLLNSRSQISCRLRKTAYFGSLTWDGKDPLFAIMNDIPHHSRCKVGDIIETSGFSSVFPPGIYIGRIASIENSEDGQSFQARINLGNDFARVQDVCVIQQELQPEVHALEQYSTQNTK